MNLIHRHVFINVLGTCAAAVAMFGFVLMAGNTLKELLGPALSGQLPLETLVHLLGLMVPVVVSYALPMGMLSGILLVLGRMSSDREITALRSSGLSVAWLSTPILFLALLGVALSVAINFQFMPVAKVAYETELRSTVRKNPLSFIVARTFIHDFPGMVLYTDAKQGNRLQGFWIWELDARNRVKRSIHAESGRVDYDDASGKLALTLEHAMADVRNQKDPEDFHEQNGVAIWERATFDLPLEKPAGSQSLHKKLQWLTFWQLMAERERLRRPDDNGAPVDRRAALMRVQVTIQEKFATAFSVLSFALVAIPLGIKTSRTEASVNLSLGLGLAMTYYFFTVIIGLADGRPWLRPDLLIWLPNLGFQGLGLWLFYKLDRS